MTGDIAIILLAAGTSSRMGGRDKLLLPIDGAPLLARAAAAALESRLGPVITVLRRGDTARRRALGRQGVEIAFVEPGGGMGASIAAGARALTGTLRGAFIALADMPDVDAPAYRRLADALVDPEMAVRACDLGGRPGHPVLFGPAHFSALAACQGDGGAKAVLSAVHRVRDVTISGHAATMDLDTPQDWERWLRSRTNPQT